MKYCNTGSHRSTRAIRRVACIAVAGMAFTFALPNAAHAQIVPPPVPADLRVDPPNEAFLLGHGVGTQNYVCQPSTSIGRVAWTLFTPQATLFGDQDEQLTTHFFSPNPDEGGIVRVTWEHSVDTSFVWARLLEAVPVTANAVPWLKLKAEGTQAGPTGGDTLTATTFIQRVNTEGGLAPATGCDSPTDIGSKRFVPYKADYVFYRLNEL